MHHLSGIRHKRVFATTWKWSSVVLLDAYCTTSGQQQVPLDSLPDWSSTLSNSAVNPQKPQRCTRSLTALWMPSPSRRSWFQLDVTIEDNNQRFLLPFCRTESLRSSFFYSSTRLWNSLPQDIINSTSPQSFRNNVEGWLRAQQ